MEAADMDVWVEHEVEGCEFPDRRLRARLGKVLTELGKKIGDTLPTACQDWAATKAAYRFFSNPRVNESIILAGHFAATQARMAAIDGPILILHDTTEFSFQRDKPEAIGKTHVITTRKDRPSTYTVCGLLMHSSLALTPQGKPLGLMAVKFWTRKNFKQVNRIRHNVNTTRIPIGQKESVRWIENLKQSTPLLHPSHCVHIGDRGSDIFEFFCCAQEVGTYFLVRTCVDRLAGAGGTTISKLMRREPIRGTHEVEVFDHRRRPVKVTLHVRFCRATVHPPIGKHKEYPAISLTMIHVHERGKPVGREPIRWKLLTDLPVNDLASAIEKLDWYAQRWKIETFHKILKSGCRAEQSKLRTAERLTNLIAVFCIIAWRVFWLTMVNRTNPQTSCKAVFTNTEITILDHLAKDKQHRPAKRTIAYYLTIVASLGGYLGRRRDPPPGNMVLWRGLSRLTDIHLGVELGTKLVGN
jgi:hypothetical protein